MKIGVIGGMNQVKTYQYFTDLANAINNGMQKTVEEMEPGYQCIVSALNSFGEKMQDLVDEIERLYQDLKILSKVPMKPDKYGMSLIQENDMYVYHYNHINIPTKHLPYQRRNY